VRGAFVLKKSSAQGNGQVSQFPLFAIKKNWLRKTRIGILIIFESEQNYNIMQTKVGIVIVK
jgi:hypothetical protein